MNIKRHVLFQRAKNCLICTTTLMHDILIEAIEFVDLFKETNCEWYTQVVKSVWLGGNIIIGDLMVTDDYIGAINEFKDSSKIKLDLVFIPGSGFGQWKRDLRGNPISEIGRKCGVTVVAIQNELIKF